MHIRKKRLVWLVAGIAVVVLAVGVPLGVWAAFTITSDPDNLCTGGGTTSGTCTSTETATANATVAETYQPPPESVSAVTTSQDRLGYKESASAAATTQNSLGYYPANKTRDGRFRQIKVEMRGVKDASVRAREGYYAPK